MESIRPPTGIESAVQAAHSQAKLALRLGVTQQAISKWILQGWVPLHRAIEIEDYYQIPRARLANPRIMTLLAAPTKESP